MSLCPWTTEILMTDSLEVTDAIGTWWRRGISTVNGSLEKQICWPVCSFGVHLCWGRACLTILFALCWLSCTAECLVELILRLYSLLAMIFPFDSEFMLLSLIFSYDGESLAKIPRLYRFSLQTSERMLGSLASDRQLEEWILASRHLLRFARRPSASAPWQRVWRHSSSVLGSDSISSSLQSAS